VNGKPKKTETRPAPWKRMSGPTRTPTKLQRKRLPMPRKLLLTLFLTSLLCVSCAKLPEGAGKWPKLVPKNPAPVFTDDEKIVLADFAKSNPEIARKIVGRNNELAALIESYNKRAREHNRKVLEVAGFDKDEIDRVEP
jgi:hypothetical protein